MSGWIFCVCPIPDYPGYFADRTGRVWSQKKRGGGLYKDKIMRLNGTKYSGYPQVLVSWHGKSVLRNVHRLVLSAFRGRGVGLHCRHLNGNPLDNRIENLKWGTAKENWHDMRLHGTSNSAERHYKARLTWADVDEIRADKTHSLTQLAKSTIDSVKRGDSWKEEHRYLASQ